MKRFACLCLLAVAALYSCKKQDPCADTICPTGTTCVDGTCVGTSSNVVITGNITGSVVWTADKVYELSGKVSVTDGSVLYIEPGTIIKGGTGTGVAASALLIARGGKIYANGTASLPIIFTSVADSIQPSDIQAGRFASPNLDPNTSGLWGGVLLLGNAPISASASEIQVEGIPTTDANGLYGGSNSADNSGVFRYVSIRHGGANIGNGNEINGLTLGGVGSGTVVENIEIVANQDDGIEIFGGTVGVRNVVVWNSGDDAVDTDQAWSGSLDNFIVVCGAATDHALEIDGPEGLLQGAHTVRRGSVKGHPAAELGDFRACAMGSFEDIFFFGFDNPISGRGDLSLTNPTGGTCTIDNFANGSLRFSNLQCILPGGVAITDVFLNGTSSCATGVLFRTVGADKSVLVGWTWLGQTGEISGFD